jgi:Cu/Zn superoxide dismutase
MNLLARTVFISSLAMASGLAACSAEETPGGASGSAGSGGSSAGSGGSTGSGGASGAPTGGAGGTAGGAAGTTGGSGQTGGSSGTSGAGGATGGAGGATGGSSGASGAGGATGGGSGTGGAAGTTGGAAGTMAGSAGAGRDAGADIRPADSSVADATSEEAGGASAVATIAATTGNLINGTATFTERAGQVTVVVDVNSCPAGMHAWHLHANASCANDAAGAGDHWVPRGEMLGEINCMSDGKGLHTFTSSPPNTWTIGGAAVSNILPHAVVVHTGPESNPGGRIGCGVPMMK